MPKKPRHILRRKLPALLTVVLGAAFIALVARLFYIQIVTGGFYTAKAVGQQLSETTIPATRGTIFDRNMKTLARSAAVWTLYVTPLHITDDAKRDELATGLAAITGIDRATLESKMQKKSSYVVLQRKVEKAEADKIKKYVSANKVTCIGLDSDSKRYYPFGNFAAQVIGFMGTDSQGLSGVETEYNSVLTGVSGRVISAKNAQGEDMPFKYDDYVAPHDGTNLVLTLDEVVQHYLETNLKQAITENKVTSKVTGIVMNVNTGEILAMATEPDFDPNNPFQLSAADLAKLKGLTGSALTTKENDLLQAMWRNKAISDPYEPGSVFKIITAAAGLEEGVVKETDTFYDPGSVKVADTTFPCWKAGGHGKQTFLQGFENSCNVVFIELGQRLGAMNFFKYFMGFGLNDKTDIDLPGEANSIAYAEKDLGPVQLASCSFGQSNKLTAIQIITAVAAAANGGYLVQPHVVKEETDSSGNVIKTFGTTVKRQVISAATSAEIDRMLEMEVEQGTGKNAYVAGYRVGGKTGTSQKLDSNDPNECVASFVGVAPCDDPQIAVLFLMDDPHSSVSNFGGVIAAPVVGNIMAEILPYLGVVPKYTADELSKLNIKAPDLVGRKVTDAVSLLSQQGLQSTKVGNGDTVTSQVPTAGNPIPKNGKIILYTGNAQVQSNIKVPDLTGKTLAQAQKALNSLGLNGSYVGEDLSSSDVKAYTQDTKAGSMVAPGTVITVKFRNEAIKVQ
ncbi:MAG: penicillin-binding transpeptidase domain-containing protein [Clostridia bacterium]|nr:penicillin-binding transpeptidase domain-containing protein [Clostridia bacterium]